MLMPKIFILEKHDKKLHQVILDLNFSPWWLLYTDIFPALLQHKENFKEMDAVESQRLQRGQKDRLDYEVNTFP